MSNYSTASVTLQLPHSNGIDVGVLSQIFNSTTNSYKYIFFLSLLDILKRRNFEYPLSIHLKEIVVEMLVNAWYPHNYFKLSFGTQDKISEKLDQLDLDLSHPILRFSDSDKKHLRKSIQEQDLDGITKDITRYVLFRLIRPFFQASLRGIKDEKINQAIIDLASNRFQEVKPFYQFDVSQVKSCQAILLHQDWIAYFRDNFLIVRGWAIWQWLLYMQQRNPSTPNIVSKIFPPIHRNSLDKISKLWIPVIQSENLRCIYSAKPLQEISYAIDHFLPWSFVAHDLPWNLIPVDSQANLLKSNYLPSLVYIDSFINLQHQALVFHSENMSPKQWEDYTNPYISDLKISTSSLLNLDHFRMAYRETIEPLLSLATQQGFTGDWIYQP